MSSGNDQMKAHAIDVADPENFRTGRFWSLLDHLRRSDPVHLCEDGRYGRYWSVTRHADVQAVSLDHRNFSSSSTLGGVTVGGADLPMFIAVDPPRHAVQRRPVAPALGPGNLRCLEPLIRGRVAALLDGLPTGVAFDWTERVAMEITAMTLATLLGFPQEHRRRLVRWSNAAISMAAAQGDPEAPGRDRWLTDLGRCFSVFAERRRTALATAPEGDLVSMMAHGSPDLSDREFLGNVLLLVIAGNDTTRHSMSGSALAMHLNPAQYGRIRADRSLVQNMVLESLRWQTSLAHMRRTALADVDLGGKRIREGDKVVMWYVSANRDEDVFEEPYRFDLDRPNLNRHLSFGYGIHRCIGGRLAELQMRILWEEMAERFAAIEVVGEPRRVGSSFVNGYEEMSVRLSA